MEKRKLVSMSFQGNKAVYPRIGDTDTHIITLLNSLNRINNLIAKVIRGQLAKKKIIQWKCEERQKQAESCYKITLPTKEVFSISVVFHKFEKKQGLKLFGNCRKVQILIMKEVSDIKLQSIIETVISERYNGFQAEAELLSILREKIAFVPPFVGIEKSEAYDDMVNHADYHLSLDIDGTIHKIPVDAKRSRAAQQKGIVKNGLEYPTISLAAVKKILKHKNGDRILHTKIRALSLDYISGKPVTKKRIHI